MSAREPKGGCAGDWVPRTAPPGSRRPGAAKTLCSRATRGNLQWPRGARVAVSYTLSYLGAVRCRRVLPSLLLAAALLTACGGEAPAPHTGPPPQGAGPASNPPAEPADAAVGVSGPTVAGGTLDGRDYEGRDVVLWFWAPW